MANSGARLLRSHRVRLPSAENGSPHGGDVDGGSGDVCPPSEKHSSRVEAEEAGMAWLESPRGAVRVLLLDDRLLSFPVRCSEGIRRSSSDSSEDLSGFHSPCEDAIDGEMGIIRKQTAVERQHERCTAGENSAAGGGGDVVASGPEPEWRASPSALLLGIAAMAGLSGDDASSGSSIASDGPECERNSAGQWPSGRESSSIRSGGGTTMNGRNGSIRRYGCSADGDGISRGDVIKESEISVSSGSDGRGEGGGVARSGREWSAQARGGGGGGEVVANGGAVFLKSIVRSPSSAKGLVETLDVDAQTGSSVGRRRSESGVPPGRRARMNGGEGYGDEGKDRSEGLEGVPEVRGVFESTAIGGRREGATEGVAHGEACLEKRNEDRNDPLAKGWRSSERPFPTMEVTMLGNLGGPLRVVPNRYMWGASPAE